MAINLSPDVELHKEAWENLGQKVLQDAISLDDAIKLTSEEQLKVLKESWVVKADTVPNINSEIILLERIKEENKNKYVGACDHSFENSESMSTEEEEIYLENLKQKVVEAKKANLESVSLRSNTYKKIDNRRVVIITLGWVWSANNYDNLMETFYTRDTLNNETWHLADWDWWITPENFSKREFVEIDLDGNARSDNFAKLDWSKFDAIMNINSPAHPIVKSAVENRRPDKSLEDVDNFLFFIWNDLIESNETRLLNWCDAKVCDVRVAINSANGINNTQRTVEYAGHESEIHGMSWNHQFENWAPVWQNDFCESENNHWAYDDWIRNSLGANWVNSEWMELFVDAHWHNISTDNFENWFINRCLEKWKIELVTSTLEVSDKFWLIINEAWAWWITVLLPVNANRVQLIITNNIGQEINNYEKTVQWDQMSVKLGDWAPSGIYHIAISDWTSITAHSFTNIR